MRGNTGSTTATSKPMSKRTKKILILVGVIIFGLMLLGFAGDYIFKNTTTPTSDSSSEKPLSYYDSLKTTVMPHIGTAIQDIGSATASRNKYLQDQMGQLQDLATNGPTGPSRTPDESNQQDAITEAKKARDEIDSAKASLASIQPAPSNMAILNGLMTDILDNLGKAADLLTKSSGGNADITIATKYMNQATSDMQEAATEMSRVSQ